MILDPSVPEQSYVEDCEVCCNPIEIHLGFMDGDLTRFAADSLEQ